METRFNKITKKKFIEDMTSSSVVFMSSGNSSKGIDDMDFSESIIDYCESVYVYQEEQCTCIAKSNKIERIKPNGEISVIGFDQKHKMRFYEYGNIRVLENVFENQPYNHYQIYVCL